MDFEAQRGRDDIPVRAAAFVRAGREECRRATACHIGECGRIVPEKHDRQIFVPTS